MVSTRERLIHLHQCRAIDWHVMARFFKSDPTLASIYQLSVTELLPYFKNDPHRARIFHQDLHHPTFQTIFLQYQKYSIIPVTVFDEHYPELLKQIYDPPWVLYGKGDITLLNEVNMVSIVGTRYPSKQAQQMVSEMIRPLVANGWVVISGLAIGVDTMAHTSTMNQKGKTIAVLGSGFNAIYPRENMALARDMVKKQLLLTEYPPYTTAEKWHFPRRNRIISGMSKGTVVIEAKEKSGSLITAYQALEEGRDVFAVPGSIFESRSKGTNKLIQEGATLVTSGFDILNGLTIYA